MLLRVLLLFGVVFFSSVICRLPTRMVREKDFEEVRMDKKGFEKAHMIHYNWYLHSIKAIMGSLGKQLMAKLHKEDKITFYRCLDRIRDRRDVVAAAQCLTAAKDAYEERKVSGKSLFEEKKERKAIVQKLQKKAEGQIDKVQAVAKTFRFRTTSSSSEKGDGQSNLRRVSAEATLKRVHAKVNHTARVIPQINFFPLGSQRRHKVIPDEKKPIKKFFSFGSSANARRFMNKWRGMSARKKKLGKLADAMQKFKKLRLKMRRRSKRSLQRLVGDTVSKSDSMKYYVKNMESMPSLRKAEKSGVHKVNNLIRQLTGIGNNTGWSQSYKNLLLLKKAMDLRAKDPGAKVYDYRMLDLVMDRTAPTNSLFDKTPVPPMIREAFNLLEAFENSPKSVSDSANIKFLSPRFAPLMPDKMEMRGKLSPSILSFYNDDAEDQILPIPKLLDSTGMNPNDKEQVLETIMELSGARQTVDEAIELLQHTKLFGIEGELKEVTERLAGHFKHLEDSFDRRQQKDMKKKGFTFMEPHQIEQMYSKQGIKNGDDVGFNLNEYKNLTKKEREESLWLRIAKIALNGTSDIEHRRSKRALVSVLAPTVLAPYMFTPILGLVILGPTVLSPSIFAPLILNPAVLSPYVFSPAVGMPFILSPYILSPYVLSPLVFAPFILNPYILAPNVINPYVLSPLILSPLVLCPDVLSPMVGGGGILSPGVASPSILSKSILMASVLSPSVLS